MDEEIRQFAVSALKEMNYDVSEVTGDTDLGPAGLDLESLAVAELAVLVEDKFGVTFTDEDAERLSWRETAQVFQTSWESVYRSVEWFVQWGLAHRQLQGVEALGVDEIHWGHGLRADNFLTVIYQIDASCRRLLWVGKRRSEATLRRGLKALGPEVIQGLRFVCSDMWKPYLNVIASEAGQALHVLDRFH